MSDTRSRLLEAARTEVRDRGLAATSREITGAAGANLAAITYHFGSKDRLVAEALLGEVRRWLEPALGALAGQGDPAARALAAVGALVAAFREHAADAPAYLEALVQARRLPGLHAGILDLWGDLRARLTAEIAALQAGEGPGVAGWVDPEPMAALLVAVANGLVVQATVDPDGPDVGAMAEQFAGLLLSARSAP
jgi:AcrR family transcriptional regulator